jgi:hypothetical protein
MARSAPALCKPWLAAGAGPARKISHVSGKAPRIEPCSAAVEEDEEMEREDERGMPKRPDLN